MRILRADNPLKRAYLVMLAVGVFAGAPWAITHALFTDSDPIGANTFATGTLALGTSPSTALVTYSDMAPGDQVTAPLALTSSGTLELRYAMSTSITGDAGLGSGLTLAIKSGVTACSDAGFATDGTSVFSGSVSGGAIGSAVQGAQAGDRTLAASGSETLCFQVVLPSSADNTLQGKSVTATFTFDSEQTKNNA